MHLRNAGKLNAYGGTIIAGSSGNGTGSCVGLQNTNCTVILGGDAKIDDIYIPSVAASTLVVAYNWYASIMGMEKLTEVNLDAIPAVLKHRNSKFPAADADGNYIVTEDMKEDVLEAVNWTLKNPFSLPE